MTALYELSDSSIVDTGEYGISKNPGGPPHFPPRSSRASPQNVDIGQSTQYTTL